VQRRLLGSLVGVASAFALGAALLPLRSHVSVSTTALVLVVPVVAGAVVGGFTAGAASVAAGFLIYDFAFIPPYNTLHVGKAENWTALVVYVIVMLLVARIVDALERARAEAQRSNDVMRRVFEVSELLVGDQPVDVLLNTIVTTAQAIFNVPGVSLLQLDEGQLVVVASAGEALTIEELHQLDPHSGLPIRVGTAPGAINELRTVALSSSGRALGILAMRSVPIKANDRAILNTFANDAALALERAQLREEALRSKLLEEADRFRRGLLGAVSHDLRTPLATIKVASSTLNNRAAFLSEESSRELHQLIEIESDRLTRLVTNLLDMTRIEAGVLTLDRSVTPVSELVKDAITSLGSTLREQRLEVLVPDSLPDVDVDHVVIGQALVNLLDNAVRHSPPHGVVTVRGERRGEKIVVSVADQGPGVPPADRETIFDRFTQLSTGGRAGLGLTIAKTFVEAHGESVWYEEVPEGGARFVISLPRAHGARS
jgi:two-component system, OmpR family, sensor histidine kinase KdpD